MPGPADARTDQRRAQDQTRVKEQLGRINKSDPKTKEYQQKILGLIRANRRKRPNAPEVDQITQDKGFVVAVVGEILVRQKDRPRAEAALGAQGFAQQQVPATLEDEVALFAKAGTSVKDTEKLAHDLRTQTIDASVSYVVPLGYVVKGEGGYEPTDVRDDYTWSGPAPGAARVKVAVIDTGMAEQARGDGWLTKVHVDAANRDDLFGADGKLDFAAGHGYFVAGVIQQVCPSADIKAYRAIGSDGIGREIDIADAILRAAGDGNRVINLSLGTEQAGDQEPVGLRAALDILKGKHPDVVVVASAGNSASTGRTWPAAIDEVIAVSSLTADLRGSRWANSGTWVDCSAVGEGVVSPYVVGTESPEIDKNPDTFPLQGADTSWAIGTGTSFAAPQVAGQIAQLVATGKAGTAQQAWEQLKNSPAPGATVRKEEYGVPLKILEGTLPA